MFPPDMIDLWMRLTIGAVILFAVVHAIPVIKLAWQVWMVGG